MRKIFNLLIGLGIGSAVGGLLVTLFSPVSSDEFKANLKAHYEKALEAGRKASVERRAELEEELKKMREA